MSVLVPADLNKPKPSSICGDASYPATCITDGEGEHWFCKNHQAEAAEHEKRAKK